MNIITIDKIDDLSDYKYNFQTNLTSKLDKINWDFDQEIINEIVLWKVNRYAEINEETLTLLNKIWKYNNSFDLDNIKDLLIKLITTKWIKLPMASSILRFKNSNLFQIIDQRVYRIIYWKNLILSKYKNEELVDLYLKYLEDLKYICNKYWINFTESDRVLYALDKKFNKSTKIDY